ncbi:MAG: sensor histidine kinase [Deltaproteobacteria bacterium]|nr:MAG: sensor histidine kinase [Deltaproteobacteria bacterium]
MRPGARRAAVGLASIAAVLLPAAGLAYLGVGSYRADRGLVARRLAEHQRAAEQVAAAVLARLEAAVDAVAAALADAEGPLTPNALASLRAAHPLARHPFYVGPDGRLRYAVPNPLAPAADPPDVGPALAFSSPRAAGRRRRQLADAHRRELALCGGAGPAGCALRARDVADVTRAYAALADADDTGPEALLALARLRRATGDAGGAVAAYDALARRFGHRVDDEGVSYALWAAVGRARHGGEGARRAVLEAILAGRYRAPPDALLAIAEDLRRAVDGDADLAAIDAALARARGHARLVATLESDADSVVRTAGAALRGRPSLRDPARTLVYRREPSGAIVGLAVDDALLSAVAAEEPIPVTDPAPTTRAIVQRVGDPVPASLRAFSTAGFGAALPHLTVSVVNDRAMPDPLDAIVRERGRRHLMLTGGLIGLLMLGLVATIRSAARERELARLKSDFVSTVSHELKTPLTSIRMFAEMLQQGVAGGDRAREARYHDILVQESERLGLLIANVLDYAQIERGTRRYTVESRAVDEVAREAVDTFARLREGDASRIEFAVEPDAAGARAAIDTAVVVQSLLNLLANAAKYGGATAPIEVRVHRSAPGWIGVSVRDRGPGIPRRHHAAIFREFYRAPEAYAAGVEGTGLGLALVKRHVEALGGRVELVSAVGRGSTFSILLPEEVGA